MTLTRRAFGSRVRAARAALPVMSLALLVPAIAVASPAKPPPGWTGDAAAAVSLSKQLEAVPHFSGLRTIVTTEVYRAPEGGAFYATRMFASAATVEADARNRAASAELAERLGAVKRAGSAAVSDHASRRALPDELMLEATEGWHDPNVVESSRIVIAADAQQLVAVIGECVLAADAPSDVASACTAALATLDPEIPRDKRVPLSIVGDAIAAPTTSSTPSSTMQVPEGSAASLDGGPRPTMPPMSIPQAETPRDCRPVYIGIGLIVLALVFWWNRRRREQLEREFESRSNSSDEGTPAREVRDRNDEDDDELHAAAEEPAPAAPEVEPDAEPDANPSDTRSDEDSGTNKDDP